MNPENNNISKHYRAIQPGTAPWILLGGKRVDMRIPEKKFSLKGWFIKKEFGYPIDGTIFGTIKETEKALQVVIFDPQAHDEDDRLILWAPKSCIEEAD